MPKTVNGKVVGNENGLVDVGFFWGGGFASLFLCGRALFVLLWEGRGLASIKLVPRIDEQQRRQDAKTKTRNATE